MSFADQANNEEQGGFQLSSELFPAFRKSAASRVHAPAADRDITQKAGHAQEYPAPEPGTTAHTYAAATEPDMPAGQPGSPEPPDADSEAEQLLRFGGAVPRKEDRQSGTDAERVPALFGDISLEKVRSRDREQEEDADREPTLLEFLSQPIDRPVPEQGGEPLPRLFDGIGSVYVSDEVLKLAAEEEAAEKARMEAQAKAQTAFDGEPAAPEPEPEEAEPSPAPEELFDLISSISRRQEEDWLRHENSLREVVRKSVDPYNTAFNNREVVIHYENIGELPLEKNYGFAPVTEEELAAYDRRAGRAPRVIGDPDPGLRFNRRHRSGRRGEPQ